MSNCELHPHHFRIFATWFRDTRRSQSAKQAKTFDGTGSSICHAIPISKLSPTTASYSKAVPSRITWRRPLWSAILRAKRFRAPRRCGYIPCPFGKGEGLGVG